MMLKHHWLLAAHGSSPDKKDAAEEIGSWLLLTISLCCWVFCLVAAATDSFTDITTIISELSWYARDKLLSRNHEDLYSLGLLSLVNWVMTSSQSVSFPVVPPPPVRDRHCGVTSTTKACNLKEWITTALGSQFLVWFCC